MDTKPEQPGFISCNLLGNPLQSLDMNTPQRIRKERKAKGWSQERLSREADVSFRTIHAAETVGVSDTTLGKIAVALGLPEDSFLDAPAPAVNE